MFRKIFSLLLIVLVISPSPTIMAAEPVHFVVQLTRDSSGYGHRRVMMQIDKILTDIGPGKVRFTVVAYEDGIHALLAANKRTNQLLVKLANRGVKFKACKISMRAWKLKEDQFPLEVEFIPAGAPEVIRLQMKGYKYWRP